MESAEILSFLHKRHNYIIMQCFWKSYRFGCQQRGEREEWETSTDHRWYMISGDPCNNPRYPESREILLLSIQIDSNLRMFQNKRVCCSRWVWTTPIQEQPVIAMESRCISWINRISHFKNQTQFSIPNLVVLQCGSMVRYFLNNNGFHTFCFLFLANN